MSTSTSTTSTSALTSLGGDRVEHITLQEESRRGEVWAPRHYQGQQQTQLLNIFLWKNQRIVICNPFLRLSIFDYPSLMWIMICIYVRGQSHFANIFYFFLSFLDISPPPCLLYICATHVNGDRNKLKKWARSKSFVPRWYAFRKYMLSRV